MVNGASLASGPAAREIHCRTPRRFREIDAGVGNTRLGPQAPPVSLKCWLWANCGLEGIPCRLRGVFQVADIRPQTKANTRADGRRDDVAIFLEGQAHAPDHVGG